MSGSPRQVGVAVGARDRHVHRRRRRDDVPKQLQGRGVGPVQVVQHHQRRATIVTCRREELARRPPAATAARCRDRRHDPCRTPASGTRRASAARCADRNPRAPPGRRCARDSTQPRSTVDTRPRGPRRRDRTTRSRLLRAPRGELRDERGLAHPGLARDEHHLAPLSRVRALAASSNPPTPAPRPKKPNSASDAAPTSRPGNGTDPSTVAGSQSTSTALTGSGMPFNSNGPISTNVCVALRPTNNRTRSAARI